MWTGYEMLPVDLLHATHEEELGGYAMEYFEGLKEGGPRHAQQQARKCG